MDENLNTTLKRLSIPQMLDDGSYDYIFGDSYHLDLIRVGEATKILYKDEYYDEVVINADFDNTRGVRALASDVQLWAASMISQAIYTVTKDNLIQPWFSPIHTNDEGATSQKISFWSI